MTFAVRHRVPAAELTTLAAGGVCATVIDCASESELLAALAAYPDAICIGQGSNLLISDSGFDGVLIRTLAASAREVKVLGSGRVWVDASVPWDALVALTVQQGLQGLEATSGVPGSMGGGIVQNAGAYGQEIGDVIISVNTWDRQERKPVTFDWSECGFQYRSSRFKHDTSRRYVVTSALLSLEQAELAQPRYGDVALLMTKDFGHSGPYPLAAIRAAVLDVRTSKGMVLGTSLPSAGSFFTNPSLDDTQAAALEADGFRVIGRADGVQLASAATLIEAVGFKRGYTRGNAGLSETHVLALVNSGNAGATEIIDLAREIRDAVHARFGLWLTPEPVMLGFTTPPFS